MRYKRYRIIGISRAISHCDIVCDRKCIAHDIAHDIALGYRMRYKRYRIIGISHAISQCDIVYDIIGYRIRYKRYRKCDKKDIAWDIAEISQWCDIACDIAFDKNPDEAWSWTLCCTRLFRAENSLENRGQVLASLERLGKTPVVPLLGPSSQGMSSLNPCQWGSWSRTDTAGQYLHQSRAASKCQIQDNTTVLCPGTIREFAIRRPGLGGVVIQAP